MNKNLGQGPITQATGEFSVVRHYLITLHSLAIRLRMNIQYLVGMLLFRHRSRISPRQELL